MDGADALEEGSLGDDNEDGVLVDIYIGDDEPVSGVDADLLGIGSSM